MSAAYVDSTLGKCAIIDRSSIISDQMEDYAWRSSWALLKMTLLGGKEVRKVRWGKQQPRCVVWWRQKKTQSLAQARQERRKDRRKIDRKAESRKK